jgi:hypothetical protein
MGMKVYFIPIVFFAGGRFYCSGRFRALVGWRITDAVASQQLRSTGFVVEYRVWTQLDDAREPKRRPSKVPAQKVLAR